MEKLKLKGMGNKDNRSFFIIGKSKNLVGFLAYFLLKCGFKDSVYMLDYQNEKNDDVKDVTKFEDTQSNYKNEYFDIDLVYGYNAIVIIVRYTKKEHKELINNIVLEYCKT